MRDLSFHGFSSHRFKGLGLCALACGLLALPALAETRIERNFDLAPGGKLVVDTDVGAVQVSGESGAGASVRIVSSRDDLESILDIDFRESAEGLTIEAEMPNRIRGFRGSVQFEIQVPRDTELEIDTSGGPIEVRSIDRPVSLDTSGGPIDVGDVRGEVIADTSGGPIRIRNVDGDVSADTSGGGIEIEDVRGDVSADTSGGPIRIASVTGDVEADTSGGGIKIRDVGGTVEADTSGGGVEVEFGPGNSSGGSISTSGGGIRVILDPGVNLEIDAQTSAGNVKCDLPVTVQGSLSRSTLRGTVGSGGARLKLRASGGGIRIEKAG